MKDISIHVSRLKLMKDELALKNISENNLIFCNGYINFMTCINKNKCELQSFQVKSTKFIYFI